MEVIKHLKQSVGLDVSKDTIAACFCQEEFGRSMNEVSRGTFKTTAEGLARMHKWIESHKQASGTLQLVMEATGVYYEEAAYFLNHKGYHICVLVPHRSSAYARSLPQKSKTDRTDAQMLAQLSLERSLPKWNPPGDNMLEIKRLCRERSELLDEKTIVNNRLHARSHAHAPNPRSLERDKKHIKFIDKQIKDIEKDIRASVKKSPQIMQKIDKVCTIPGVGFITAVTVIAEANGFTLFKNKAQLVSYAGYDVVLNESGNSRISPARISKRGNTRIRKALYFPAIVAVKKCPQIKNVFDRILQRHWIKMKAYTAIQRKLLVLIYILYNKDTAFDPLYQNSKLT